MQDVTNALVKNLQQRGHKVNVKAPPEVRYGISPCIPVSPFDNVKRVNIGCSLDDEMEIVKLRSRITGAWLCMAGLGGLRITGIARVLAWR